MDFNFTEFFATLAGFTAGVIALTQVAKNLFHIEKPVWKRMTAWIISILACIAGFVAQTGMFADFGPINEWQGWVKAIIVGITGGIVANGTYSIEFIKPIVHWIFQFMEKKEPEVINE